MADDGTEETLQDGADASTDVPSPAGSEGRARRAVRSPFVRWGALALVLLLAGAAWYTWSVVSPLVESAQASDVAYVVPDAPRLVATTGETVFRIDPTRSSVSYSVEEQIVGQSAGSAKGTTNGIAGDIALNPTDPGASRVGQIVVNVEQLHSDNNLRDARIRQDYLESHQFPLATFSVDSLSGMPTAISDGQPASFTMAGTLTAHGTTIAVTWSVDATRAADQLSATATTTVKLSDLGAGPISLAGLVTTKDDVTLTMELVALDPSKTTIPTRIDAPAGALRSGSSPPFSTAVAPILSANCASCHATGEVGSARWTLDTAGDASKISDGIATVVASGYMPPWPASDVGVPLAHSRKMSQADIDTLIAWGRAGGVLDVPESTPVPVTTNPDLVQVRHDAELTMPDAYTGSPDNVNDYRCFVLDPGFTQPTYVTGYEVTPGVREEIHHARIFHIDASQAAAGMAQSGSDGRPGWSCYAGPSLRSTAPRTGAKRAGLTGQPGLIAGWVPGQDPSVYPDGSGVLFQPGDAVVLQVHYHYEGEPTPDRTSVALQTEPGTASVRPVDIINPLAPVEIPCMPGDTAALCDRSAALAEAGRLYGPAGSFTEPGLLLLCGQTPQQMTVGFAGVASSTCDSTVPTSGRIVSAMGHMHTLGQTFRLTLDPGGTGETVLLDIPQWNFDWQMNYSFAQPVHVEAGQKIRMTCTWDRSKDPNRPSKYIVFAEGTEDEMCFSTYALIPDKP